MMTNEGTGSPGAHATLDIQTVHSQASGGSLKYEEAGLPSDL